MTIKISLSLYVILNTIFDHPVLKISYHTDHMNTCIVESWEFIEFTVLLQKSMLLCEIKISITLILSIHLDALNIKYI